MTAHPVISASSLTKIYGKAPNQIRALNGVDLTIMPGEFVAIIGSSGSGKSTLMNMLGGLDQPNSGDVVLSGQSLKSMNKKSLARFRNELIGFVFQQFQLLPKKSALRNVTLPLQYRRPREDNEIERARQSLERVGLGDRVKHKPTELSGGQQQRVAIARALVGEPKLLLADEPTGALDSQTSSEVMTLLKNLNSEGITIVLITHDPEVAANAKRVVTMQDGKIVEDTQSQRLAS